MLQTTVFTFRVLTDHDYINIFVSEREREGETEEGREGGRERGREGEREECVRKEWERE